MVPEYLSASIHVAITDTTCQMAEAFVIYFIYNSPGLHDRLPIYPCVDMHADSRDEYSVSSESHAHIIIVRRNIDQISL